MLFRLRLLSRLRGLEYHPDYRRTDVSGGIVARHPGAQGSGCLVQNLTPSITGTVTLEKGDNNRTYLTGLF